MPGSKHSCCFLALGTLASATYIINDLLDLAADRQHPVKRFRPFASGQISVRGGLAAATALILVTSTVSVLLPLSSSISLLAYLVLTLCYSLWLKHVPMADVMLLAGLFTLRVAAGGLAPDNTPVTVAADLLDAVLPGARNHQRYARTRQGVAHEPEHRTRPGLQCPGSADTARDGNRFRHLRSCHLHDLPDQRTVSAGTSMRIPRPFGASHRFCSSGRFAPGI